MPHLSPMSWSFSLLLFTLFAFSISIIIWWNKYTSFSVNMKELIMKDSKFESFNQPWL